MSKISKADVQFPLPGKVIHLSTDNNFRPFGEKEASASELSEVSGFSITKRVFLLHVLQVAEVNFLLKGHSSGKNWPFTSLFFPHGQENYTFGSAADDLPRRSD